MKSQPQNPEFRIKPETFTHELPYSNFQLISFLPLESEAWVRGLLNLRKYHMSHQNGEN